MSIYKRIREYSLNPLSYWKISIVSHAFLHFLCLKGLTIVVIRSFIKNIRRI